MGHLDENQKNANLEAIITEKIPQSRHFMLKIVQEFLKTPSKEMIKHIGEIERQRQQEISKKRPIKIV